MSTSSNTTSGGTLVTVEAQPESITVGGTVLLIADPPPDLDVGTYDVEWSVVGPVHVSGRDTHVTLLGTTTLRDGQIEVTLDSNGKDTVVPEIRAVLDTSPLTVGSWRVHIKLTPDAATAQSIAASSSSNGPGPYEGESDPIDVRPRPFAAGDDVAVTLKRSAVPPTPDQALWVAIRRSATALGFDNYQSFLNVVMCGEWPDASHRAFGFGSMRHDLHKAKRHTALPFPNVDRYRLLKAATQVFIMTQCGVDLGDFRGVDLAEESRRLGRPVNRSDLEDQMRDYLMPVPTGDGGQLDVLPYLGLIRRQLGDISIVGLDDGDEEAVEICQGIIAEKLTNPCLLELLWSYWHDEGGLVQTMNAITWRFQNRTSAPRGRDPLAGLAVDPLRPLSSLLWGWVQDSQHRLTIARRAYEYDHEYGLVLAAKPGPPVRGADTRSRFVESFHHLLSVCAEFFHSDDDTTMIADGFGVLNALKETHIILTQGAHNQYGDLAWTARHEMLMNQWILARPEMREFLPTRTMVVEPEPWISRVEAMNQLQGWSDTAVLHFRDLAVFGEQLLLGIRFGSWTTVNEPERAANFARYWRSEIQRYTHAYRAVTGVDLTRQVDRSVPAFHLRRRRMTYPA